jgi:hypothetical protein
MPWRRAQGAVRVAVKIVETAVERGFTEIPAIGGPLSKNPAFE